MKDKIKALVTILLSSIVILTAFVTLYSAAPVQAAFSLQDIDNAITNALNWIDRYIYFEINSTHAISLTAPFLQFRILHPNGRWTISGKTTDVDGKPVNWPSGSTRDNMRGGCVSEYVANRNNITGETYSTIPILWKFDCDGNGDISDIILYTELVGWNATHEKLFIQVKSCGAGFSNANYLLQLMDKSDITQGSTYTNITANIVTGSNWLYVQYGGFRTRQAFMRPTLKGLADLYYNLNRTINPATGNTYAKDRGINYTNRAKKLLRTFYGSGYILDRFDGMYNATLKERPFPDINQGYGPTPDLISEIKNSAVFPDNSGPYRNDNDKDQYWYSYSNYQTNINYVNRHASISRAGMPDDKEFAKSPFLCDGSNFIYSYESRTAFAPARNQYIANGLEFDLKNYNYLQSSVPWIDIVQGFGSDVKMLRVCEDLYKYNNSIPYGNDQAKSMIKNIMWDGYGIACDYFFNGLPFGWNYPAYATHITAPYLLANTLMYRASGDSWFAARADDIASILMRVQVRTGTRLYNRNEAADMYMPDWVGGFLAGYVVAYSFGHGDILWEDWSSIIFNGLHTVYERSGGILGGFVYDTFPYMAIPSPESSLPATWALIEYRKLGRTPPSPTSPHLVLPWQDCTVYMDHGGANGGDGFFEVCSSRINQTHIGGSTGNMEKFTGDVDRIRLGAYGIYGNGWASVNYTWNFTLDRDVINLRSKLYFTVPKWSGVGINDLQINITIKYRNGTIIKTEKVIPFSGISANDGRGMMICFDNQTVIKSLAKGNYTIDLYFRCGAGGGGELYLGYRIIPSGQELDPWYPDMPIGLEWFGLDYDRVATAMKTQVDGQYAYLPQNSTNKNVTGIRVEMWFTNSTAEGDQSGGTSPYYEWPTWPDNAVNIIDQTLITQIWGYSDNEARWLPKHYMADIVEDHVINILDLSRVSQNWQKTGSWYSYDMSNIRVKFSNGTWDGTWKPLNSLGYIDVPNNATYLATAMKFAKYNSGTGSYDPIGTMVTFYTSEIGK